MELEYRARRKISRFLEGGGKGDDDKDGSRGLGIDKDDSTKSEFGRDGSIIGGTKRFARTNNNIGEQEENGIAIYTAMEADENGLSYQYYEFGDGPLFQPLHRLFFIPRAIYVVLFDLSELYISRSQGRRGDAGIYDYMQSIR